MSDLKIIDGASTLVSLALALGLGLLVGVQRGWVLRHEVAGSRFAGVRTFGLIGLAGGLAGIIEPIEPAVAVILVAATALLILLGYAATRTAARLSGTTSLVALVMLACGFLAAAGQAQVASTVAVVVTILLAAREKLHGWIDRLAESDLAAIARFALISIVILPLLPDRQYGPYNAWNPHQLWLVVVFVSGFSFLGYIASKRFGAERGTLVMAATGAMVSSTAVTAALATRLRKGESAPILAAGIATASAVMLARVIILVALIAPLALPTVALLVTPPALVSLGAAGLALRRARHAPPSQDAPPIAVHNPFDLLPALGLMAMVMILAPLSRWAMDWIGTSGLALILAVSGTADVDSAIITLGGLPAGTLGARTAGLALAAPVMANTLFKAATAVTLAGWRRGWPAALPLVASVAAGLAILPLVPG